MAGGSADENTQSRISRTGADKVVVPNWPKIHELEFWKSQVTSNIVAASSIDIIPSVAFHVHHYRPLPCFCTK